MLNELCEELNNWFVKDTFKGTYTVSAGEIDLSTLIASGDLQRGQYFRIRGSVFNDGVYQYPAYELEDETFTGEIWTMAVPRDVIDLKNDIADWLDKYGDKVDSPYTSESLFGDYSYTLASGSTGDGGSIKWQSVFARRLNRWRKLR